MGADDKVLSQAEIDALLNNSAMVPKAPAAPKPVVPPVKAGVAAPPPAPKAAPKKKISVKPVDDSQLSLL